MKVIIDRFEGEYAVCEKDDTTMMDIPRKNIPEIAKEGDVLLVSDSSIVIDQDETARRKESIKKLMDKLWE